MKRPPSFLLVFNWAILSNCWFLVASFLWVVSPIWCWASDESATCDYIAFAGSICFVINGICTMIEWWNKRAACPLTIYGGGGVTKRWIEVVDWQLVSNITFFFGAFGDVCTTTVDSWLLADNVELGLTVSGYSDIVATHLWVVSGLTQLTVWTLNKMARKRHNAPIQFTFRPCSPSSPAKLMHHETIMLYDWGGVGDWLFLPGGVLYALGSYRCFWKVVFHECWTIQTLAGLCYFINALSYWPSILLERRYPFLYSLDHSVLLSSLPLRRPHS